MSRRFWGADACGGSGGAAEVRLSPPHRVRPTPGRQHAAVDGYCVGDAVAAPNASSAFSPAPGASTPFRGFLNGAAEARRTGEDFTGAVRETAALARVCEYELLEPQRFNAISSYMCHGLPHWLLNLRSGGLFGKGVSRNLDFRPTPLFGPSLVSDGVMCGGRWLDPS